MGTAPIREVIDGALTPHRTGSGQITADGPPLDLSARQSLALALAIHELATNAVKYGALSTKTGHIDVSWQIGAPGSTELFRLSWIERGGPEVKKPERRGFGSTLVERALAQDFRGTVALDFNPLGVRCELTSEMRNLEIDLQDDLTSDDVNQAPAGQAPRP